MKRRAPLKRKVVLAPGGAALARSPLSRSQGLARAKPGPSAGGRTPQATRAADRRIRRERDRRSEPGYAEWHAPIRGECAVCGKPGLLVRHHAVQEQVIRRHGGDAWDLRWSLELHRHCDCHERHHAFGVRDTRLNFKHVPAPAVRLAVATMGEGPAEAYFKRHYRNAPDQLPIGGRNDGGK